MKNYLVTLKYTDPVIHIEITTIMVCVNFYTETIDEVEYISFVRYGVPYQASYRKDSIVKLTIDY